MRSFAKFVRLALWLVFFAVSSVYAGPFGLSGKIGDFRQIKADNWSVIGKNLIIEGHVFIPQEDKRIYADRAIINIENQDFEVSGNIRMICWTQGSIPVSPQEFVRLQNRSQALTKILGVTGDIWGEQKLLCQIKLVNDTIKAEKLSGNLQSGFCRFEKVVLRSQSLVCRADFGERNPDGVIEVKNGKVSACSYLEHDNAHYAVGASKIRLTPVRPEFYGFSDMERDRGEYNVLLFNGYAQIYGVPFLWLPVFYKPKDESLGLFCSYWGKSSDWGYFVSVYKNFLFSEYPEFKMKLMGDWYEMRGWGYGLSGRLVSDNSRTDFFAYSIWDKDPLESDDYDLYRIKVPHKRYDFRITNVTHITPRLDFRGAFEYMSDPYMTRDFFSTRYDAMPQPATYLALEQQFDHLSASIYFRPKVMDFLTTVERLPEFQINVQRQQIFDLPIYYGGNTTAGYLRMNWLEFDEPPAYRRPDDELKNYEAFRFDTTHFFYLPVRNRYFTFVPRAGFKFTAYSKSSKTKVKDGDLLKMFAAADPENTASYNLKHYDGKGSSKGRFLGELGFELTTKIHNTWQGVRVPWMKLDGLRHIMRPYLNYTYISNPSEDKDNLYYFDDIDRIDKQSFLRIGLENTLQTRSGTQTRDYLRLENFIDLHTSKERGVSQSGEENSLSQLGDFCTILTMSPFKGLTFNTQIQIDAGGNNEKLEEVTRNGRPAGHPGINVKWLNRWNMSINYSPIDDFSIFASYDYMRPYASRSTYSMGSTLTSIEGGRWFDRDYFEYSETISAGFSMPLTPDRRTFMSFTVSYDFEAGHVSNYTLTARRIFHCFELLALWEFEYDHEDGWENSFGVQVLLTGLNQPFMKGKNEVLQSAGNLMRGGSGTGNRIF